MNEKIKLEENLKISGNMKIKGLSEINLQHLKYIMQQIKLSKDNKRTFVLLLIEKVDDGFKRVSAQSIIPPSNSEWFNIHSHIKEFGNDVKEILKNKLEDNE